MIGTSLGSTWTALSWQEAGLAAKTARREVPRPRSPAARCSTMLKMTLKNDHQEGSNSTHRPDSTPMSTTTTRWTLPRSYKKQHQGDLLLAKRRRPHGAEPCCKLCPFQDWTGGRSNGYLLAWDVGSLDGKGKDPIYMQTRLREGWGTGGGKRDRCRGQTGVLLVQIGLRGLTGAEK